MFLRIKAWNQMASRPISLRDFARDDFDNIKYQVSYLDTSKREITTTNRSIIIRVKDLRHFITFEEDDMEVTKISGARKRAELVDNLFPLCEKHSHV